MPAKTKLQRNIEEKGHKLLMQLKQFCIKLETLRLKLKKKKKKIQILETGQQRKKCFPEPELTKKKKSNRLNY